MYCLMKVQNKRPLKYIAYSLVSCYLRLILSDFIFSIIFCYDINMFLIISTFSKIGKAVVSKWYQKLNDKLIREYFESVSQYLGS